MADTTTRIPSRIYRGAAGAGIPRLSGLPGVDHDDLVPQHVVEVERYDTDDHRLAAAGIALAVHRVGQPDGRSHWQLDLPGTPDPLRVPLESDTGSAPEVPGELHELVRGASRERAVRPVGRVRRVRTETRLLGEGDRLLATVVHDDVTLATLGRSTDVESWAEVELRPVDADRALINELEERFLHSGLQPADSTAEAELDRMLRPAPPVGTRKRPGKDSAGAVLMDYLAAQVDRIAAEDLRVRQGQPDSVHQLRVAARRARSAMQSYRRLLDRERTDPLVDGLREFARALAPARDAEVLHERISTALGALAPELLMGPAQAQVTRHFTRVEAEAGAAVLSELDSDRYARLRTALDELVARPPLTARAARPARKELPKHVARTARRLDRAVTTALDPALPAEERDTALHTARKAGKRLRYATEVARPAVGKDAKRFAKALKGIHSALGEHQDIVVARGALREQGALAHAADENGFSFGVLYGCDAARAAGIENGLAGMWSTAWKFRNRRWLR